MHLARDLEQPVRPPDSSQQRMLVNRVLQTGVLQQALDPGLQRVGSPLCQIRDNLLDRGTQRAQQQVNENQTDSKLQSRRQHTKTPSAFPKQGSVSLLNCLIGPTSGQGKA